jgi:glycerophosphoryl diester phosphodiesterase
MPTLAEDLVAIHSPPRVVAHRGASAFAPENTVASYKWAMERGSTAHECDVHLTSDGEIVVIHDDTLDRTTSGTGRVDATTLASIRSLDAGSWFHRKFTGEPVPTLDDVLEVTRGTVLVVEIKEGPGMVEAIRDLLDARQQRDEVVIFSFDHDMIRTAHELLPDVPSVFLAWREDQAYGSLDVAEAMGLGASAIGFDHRTVTKELVQTAHAAGLAVFAWTANKRTAIRRVRGLGVDVVISDYPDRAARICT